MIATSFNFVNFQLRLRRTFVAQKEVEAQIEEEEKEDFVQNSGWCVAVYRGEMYFE